MTRNVVFGFLQNLTTSKKHQPNKLHASNDSQKISDNTLFGVKQAKSVTKPKSKCDNQEKDHSICTTSIVDGKPKKKTSSKTKFFLRKSRSANSVSISLSPTSPSTDAKHQLLPKQPHNLPATIANNDVTCANNSNNVDDKPTKRKSLDDAVPLQSNFLKSSIRHDLSKRNQSDCSPIRLVVSNSDVMPNLPNMTTSTNDLFDQDGGARNHLQQTTNSSVNVSSNSSLNSSSVKPIVSKSSDGVSTDKKRKVLSSSRQKKFHRRFKQVAVDEEVINYFSCAFVSDILLQGHMYITNNHVAFYSNVFGYVTKLLIPLTSMTKLSKEKTVKIIPNALAVATGDERHVFSSFLSREAAYQLIISVWKEALPTGSVIEVSTTFAELKCAAPLINADTEPRKISTLQVHHRRTNSNSGLSEVDDESSSAISGNECLRKLLQSQKSHSADELILNDQLSSLNCNSSCNSNSNSNPSNCDLIANRDSNSEIDVSQLINANSLASTPKVAGSVDKLKPTQSETSSIDLLKYKIPRTVHIAYFGVSLAIILALVAIFLFYRITELKSTRLTRSFPMDDLNANIPNANVYAEILKWQKDMQAQRIHLTRNVLASNLEQISQISDSLQTLSSLIHSQDENRQINDKISTIMDECNSLEACVMRQDAAQP